MEPVTVADHPAWGKRNFGVIPVQGLVVQIEHLKLFGCRSLLAGDFVARAFQPVSLGATDWKVRATAINRLPLDKLWALSLPNGQAGSAIGRGTPK